MGFQALIIAITDLHRTLFETTFDNIRFMGTIDVTSEWPKTRFWKGLDQEVVRKGFTKGNFAYVHEAGFTPSNLRTNPIFNREMLLLGTGVDQSGKEFAALVEHKIYPFIGSQGHPEKVMFEPISTSDWL